MKYCAGHESGNDSVGGDALDALALYALDLLQGPDRHQLESHLQEGCTACEAQLRDFREAAAGIAFSAPAAEPPPRLKASVMSRVAGAAEGPGDGIQVWKQWTAERPASLHVVRADEGAWEEVRKGVCVRRLHVDVQRDTVTMLIRMAPGSSWVPHRHAGPEHCYVLEGDLREGELVIRQGDYQCLAEGSTHGVQSTESGCLLLIASSLRDELLT